MNFFKDLYNKYFSVNLKDYPNIGIDLEINKLLFLVFVGIAVACFIINYNQSNLAVLLKKLLRAEAFSEEKSKTLAELGLADNKAVKSLIIKNSGVVKKVVSVVGRKKLTYEEYIEAEKQKKAAKKIGLRSKSQETFNNSNNSVNEEANGQNSQVSPELDLNSARLYVSPEMKEYAEHSFINNNGSIIKTALYCLLIFAFYLAIAFAMPSLLEAINSLVSQ